MPSDAEPYPWNELLGRLLGCRLFSVQFVLDYVQLHFDGPTADQPILTCDVFPVVEVRDRQVDPGQLGYADALVSLVSGHVLATAEAESQGLRLELDTGALVVRPDSDELAGPEIARLSRFEDGQWMCWRPGEVAFEYLT